MPRLLRKKEPNKTEMVNILDKKAPFAVTEAYKSVRTNLMFLLRGEGCKKIAFTSAVSSEGKTTTCINLAITFAQGGLRTLIIDGDMRKPRVHRFFGIKPSPGLSDRLGGFVTGSCVYATSEPNLFVMPVGTIPPNPAELMASKAMGELLRSLSQNYDYIFIDTPPVCVVTDAAVISSTLHGAVLVVRQGETRKEELKNAVFAMKQAGANILGFIFNDVDIRSRGYPYRHDGKYGYLHSYGDQGEER